MTEKHMTAYHPVELIGAISSKVSIKRAVTVDSTEKQLTGIRKIVQGVMLVIGNPQHRSVHALTLETARELRDTLNKMDLRELESMGDDYRYVTLHDLFVKEYPKWKNVKPYYKGPGKYYYAKNMLEVMATFFVRVTHSMYEGDFMLTHFSEDGKYGGCWDSAFEVAIDERDKINTPDGIKYGNVLGIHHNTEASGMGDDKLLLTALPEAVDWVAMVPNDFKLSTKEDFEF